MWRDGCDGPGDGLRVVLRHNLRRARALTRTSSMSTAEQSRATALKAVKAGASAGRCLQTAIQRIARRLSSVVVQLWAPDQALGGIVRLTTRVSLGNVHSDLSLTSIGAMVKASQFRVRPSALQIEGPETVPRRPGFCCMLYLLFSMSGKAAVSSDGC